MYTVTNHFFRLGFWRLDWPEWPAWVEPFWVGEGRQSPIHQLEHQPTAATREHQPEMCHAQCHSTYRVITEHVIIQLMCHNLTGKSSILNVLDDIPIKDYNLTKYSNNLPELQFWHVFSTLIEHADPNIILSWQSDILIKQISLLYIYFILGLYLVRS